MSEAERFGLRLEAVDDDLLDCLRHTGRVPRTTRLMHEAYLRSGHGTAWVVRLSRGRNGALRRERVPGYKDFTDANTRGSRGVFYYYALAPGVYEVNAPVKRQRCDRYFIRVAGGAAARIGEEEVQRCLPPSSAG